MAPSVRRCGLLLVLAWAFAACACGRDATGPESRYPDALAHDVNPEILEQAYAQARETQGIRSLLVQRHGVLIAEEYFQGAAADSLYQVWSVTKSVMSILAGIALDRDDLTSLDQTLADFLPPVVDSLPDDKGGITVRQLLTMTCGLEWHELDGGGQYGEWVRSPDMVEYVIDLPWQYPPGEVFHYHTGCTHLLSVVLTEATGTPMLEFARHNLFEPLGIEDAEWWTDERGYFTGGMGLHLRPRDMMRIGELFLREGRWDGAQVVPAAWVRESTSAHVSTGPAIPFGHEYGYLWWVGRGQGRDFYFANGYGGQFILVSPELDLVVVATSTWRDFTWQEAGAQWGGVIDVVVNGVLPAVQP
jgi:CubicO group peptidase (beta-lactamase class C family)